MFWRRNPDVIGIASILFLMLSGWLGVHAVPRVAAERIEQRVELIDQRLERVSERIRLRSGDFERRLNQQGDCIGQRLERLSRGRR